MKINRMGIVRDVLMIYCFTFVGGLVTGRFVAPGPARMKFLIVLSLFLQIAGFTISGCVVKINRFKHLFIVAIGLWIVNLSSVALGLFSFTTWLISLVSILLTMLIGGGISFLLVRPPKVVDVPTNPSSSTSDS